MSHRRELLPQGASALLLLLLVIGLADSAAGSCLQYGHSCWGAHGKRSGNPGQVLVPPPSDTGDGMEEGGEASPDDTRWILSKLVVPSRSQWRQLEAAKSRAGEEGDRLASRSGIMADDAAGPILVPAPEFPEELSPEMAGELLLMAAPEEETARRTPQKLHLYQIMNHGAARKMD
ncbi:uncharacterized protein [Anabrus simplex]|uniref:uncharacterized protein n=1 Tax=Anabrus simplex TaxID=316456 RepID=UPI0035A30973